VPAGPGRSPWIAALVFGVAVALVYRYTIGGETGFDQYKRLADALLHGHLNVINPPANLEMVKWGDRQYIIPPPMPAILMLPYVAVLGLGASQTLFSAVAGGASAGLACLIAARLGARSSDRWWLGVLFAFGTILWYLAAYGSVWFLAHVVAVLGLNAALLETVGQKRPYLIGAGLAAAFWTHLPAVLTLPFFVLMTIDRWAPEGLRRWRAVRLGYLNALAAPIAVAMVLNFGYNWLRFGTIADVAYAIAKDPNSPWFDRGLFSLSYIPRHLRIFLLAAPRILPDYPYLFWSITGLAIWVTTPPFLLALLAPLRALGTWAAWAGIVPTAILVMSHGAIGMEQFGYRLAVDFYPLVFYLTIMGMRPPLRPIHKATIVVAVLVNLWGVVWARMGWKIL